MPVYWHLGKGCVDMSILVDGYFTNTGGTGLIGRGQSFTGNGMNLDYIQFYFYNNIGSPTGNITAKIYAHSGTFGVDGIPTGTELATVTKDVSTLVYGLNDFIFTGTNRITLSKDVKFCAVVTFPYSATDYPVIAKDDGTHTHSGNAMYFSSPNWVAENTSDMHFAVYGSYNDQIGNYYRHIIVGNGMSRNEGAT